ncbi:MAG TPA: NAD(P)H-binding protein, partial [Anaerolineales bacterium]|nr:NAD(P)H-binding protein [Anaerolineales bacterium]
MTNPADTQIAITGAFSYSGKYIAKKLLAQGCQVRTLTGNPSRPNPFDVPVPADPFNFEQPDKLIESLAGVDVLISTYWVRFDHGQSTFLRAVSNVRHLFRAAKAAGVRRVVHISITNPNPFSDLPYFWGKAILEEDLKASGMSYAILRPTVIFGKEDILINNITWFLRRFPLFPIPGDGEYRLQPIYVEDLAELAAAHALSDESITLDAIGPETFTFNQLVSLLRKTAGSRTLVTHAPPMLAQKLSGIVGKLMGDVIL